jgi:hypothetical protein
MKGTSQATAFIKESANVMRRWWTQLKPHLVKIVKGGAVTKPEQGSETRWCHIKRAAPWFFQTSGFAAATAVRLSKLLAPGGGALALSKLSEKEKWVLKQMSSQPMITAVAVAGDLAAEVTQLTLWSQRYGSFRMAEVHAALIRLLARLEALATAVEQSLQTVDKAVLQSTKLLYAGWRKGEPPQKLLELLQHEQKQLQEGADLLAEGAELLADEREIAAEQEDDEEEDDDGEGAAGAGSGGGGLGLAAGPLEHKARPRAARGKEAKEAPLPWMKRVRSSFEPLGAAPVPRATDALPLLTEYAAEYSAKDSPLPLGWLMAAECLKAAIDKFVRKFEAWFVPDLLLAAIADPNVGTAVAARLVSEGQQQCLQAIAHRKGRTAEWLRAKILQQAATYRGPLLMFVDAAPWQLLVALAADGAADALTAHEEHAALWRLWRTWFEAMPITNAPVEEIIKKVKALDGQTRASKDATDRQISVAATVRAVSWPGASAQ